MISYSTLRKCKHVDKSELDRRFDIDLIKNEKLNGDITQYLLVDWVEIGKSFVEGISEGIVKDLDLKKIIEEYNEEQK